MSIIEQALEFLSTVSTPLGGALVVAIGVWAALYGVRHGERHQREKERTAELRVAHADFAVIAALTINRIKHSEEHVLVLYTNSQFGWTIEPRPGEEKEWAEIKARCDALDAEVESKRKELEAPYLRVRLLERKRDQRERFKALYENILYWRPKGKERENIDPETSPAEAWVQPMNMETELYDELHAWMDEQAERTDL